MRIGILGVVVVLGILGGTASAQEAPEQTYNYQIMSEVYLDLDQNGSADEEDARVAGWEISAYDATFTLLNLGTSEVMGSTPIGTNEPAVHVCITPQAGFAQTQPLGGVQNPFYPEWLCYQTSEQSNYVFGVAQIEDEPEDIPEVLGESNVEPIEKELPEEGAVLGATSPEVLAETGVEIILPILVGVLLSTGVILLACRPQID